MKIICKSLLIGLVAFVLLPLSVLHADDPQTFKVALEEQTGRSIEKIITPKLALDGGYNWYVRNGEGEITVGDQQVLISAKRKGRQSIYIGVDSDGDGKIRGREWKRVSRKNTARVKLKSGKGKDAREIPIALSEIQIRFSSSGKTRYIWAKANIAEGMTGKFKGQKFTLLDTNMDGQYGRGDAIAIGRSLCAQPLGKVHKIGSQFYSLDIADDGKSVTLEPYTTESLAQVDTRFRASMLESLILKSSDGVVCDISGKGKIQIPPGNYTVSYGLLSKKREVVYLKPSKLNYEIKAEHRNILRIGPPFVLHFQASFTSRVIDIAPSIKLLGSGGETYRFTDRTPLPHVYFYAGKRRTHKGRMTFG